MAKGNAKKVDIILLQDESGSMDKTDPLSIRKLVATTLIEDQEVAGEGNRMSIILFGATTEGKIGICRDFEEIMKISSTGFEPHTGPNDRRTQSAVPARGYTDIYGAIEAAQQLFLKDKDGGSLSDNREKHVILLTDGKMEPWPGNEMRYGDIAAEYLNCVKNGNYRTCDDNFTSNVKAIDTERLFERGGLLETFRKNGWRIHCVGFSSGVDQEMLRRISEATYGHHGVAEDLTQLLGILDQIIPPAPNVVTLYVDDFCDTQQIEKTVNIENDIKAVLFKIDLNSADSGENCHLFRK